MDTILELINRLINNKSDLKWLAFAMMAFTFIIYMWFFQYFQNYTPPVVAYLPTQPPAPTAQPTEQAQITPTVIVRDPRCIPASDRQFQNIVDGLDESTSVYIKSAWAVKSKDYENVYFVAAMLYGPGMGDGAGPGVWAISGDPDNTRLNLSVGGMAVEFSLFPDGSKTDAELSMFDDGWQIAADCALADKQ